MRGGWRWAGALVVAGAVWAAGCGGDAKTTSPGDGQEQPAVTPPGNDKDAGPGQPDAGPGTPDSGTGTPDAGTPDSGTPDAGSGTPDSGTPDSGTPDAGPEAPVNVTPLPPSSAGWKFYGVQQGGPKFVYGATADEGGNIWVAGGEEGLFLLKAGEDTFRRFTLADGLRPYGFLHDGVGGAPQGTPYLKVLSVAGGPAGTVFVGYEGKPAPANRYPCEDEWDNASLQGREPDASIYKSGDADKVTLKADGTLKVVHYDIYTGPNTVRDEPRGREKLCTIYRIAYDKHTGQVWFGGNHGFAMGDAHFEGTTDKRCFDPRPYTTPGYWWDFSCTGVFEHVHPAVNSAEGPFLTDNYYGIAVAPNGDVFFGGLNRSTRFLYGKEGYWSAQTDTENNTKNQFDIWPDAVPDYPRVDQRKDDGVSGIALMGDGTIWVSSFEWGLAHLRAGENVASDGYSVLGYEAKNLVNYSPKTGRAATFSVAADPGDGGLWAGAGWGGGITRFKGGGTVTYGMDVFGNFALQHVRDIQADRSGGKRRMLVSFSGMQDGPGKPISTGGIGIYSGD